MSNGKKLTASNIRYLIAIKGIKPIDGGTRCVDIARAMGYKRPSVHKMMDSFVGMGLVEKSPRGTIRFTKRGEKIASKYSRYYVAVEKMIRDAFPEAEETDDAVCSLLSALPESSLGRYV